MTDHDPCSRTLPTLLAAIDAGETPAPEAVAHWGTCPSCRRLVEATRRCLTDQVDAPDVATTLPDRVRAIVASAVEVATTRKRRAFRWRAGIVISVFCLSSAAWAAGRLGLLDARTNRLVDAFLVAALLPSAAALGVQWACQKVALFKRLRKGHQVSGVCLGVAEKTGVSVVLIRFLFIALVLFHGAGLWLYLFLDLVMPIHPADRSGLLRFRLARSWGGFWRTGLGRAATPGE